MKAAYVIIRVSAQDQLKGYGIESQWKDDIIPGAAFLNLEVSEKYRRNIQESATGWERVKFESLMHEALALFKSGEIQALLFPRVDRETRFIFSSFPLLSEVVKAGLPVYFAREKLLLDPHDPEAVERYLMKTVQSQSYVTTMKTNTLRGKKARAREHGKLPSGGYCFFGYKYDKKTGKYTINEVQANIVRMIFKWLIEGHMSVRAIVRRLNAEGVPAPKGGPGWGRSTAARILTNPEYYGKCQTFKTVLVNGKRVKQDPQNWIDLPDAIPPIISRDLFEKAQGQLEENRHNGPTTRKNDYLLKGRVFCGKCGQRYHGLPCHGKRYYRCSSHGGSGYCRNKMYQADNLEARIWDHLKERIKRPEMFISEIEKRMEPETRLIMLQAERDIQQDRADKLKRDIERLVKLAAAIDNVDIASVAGEIRKKREEIKTIEEDIQVKESKLNDYRQAALNREDIEEVCRQLAPEIDQADDLKKRQTFTYFGVKVILHRDRVDVEYSPVKSRTLLGTGP